MAFSERGVNVPSKVRFICATDLYCSIVEMFLQYYEYKHVIYFESIPHSTSLTRAQNSGLKIVPTTVPFTPVCSVFSNLQSCFRE